MSSAVSVKVATNVGGRPHRNAVGNSKETPVMTSAGDFNKRSKSACARLSNSLLTACAGCGKPDPVPSMITEAQRKFREDSTVKNRAR